MLPTVRINSAGTVRCETDWSWRPTNEKMKDFDLWYAWAGHGQMRRAGGEFAISAGTMFCLPPRVGVNASHDPKRRLGVSYIHFDFCTSRGRPFVPEENERPPIKTQVRDVEFFDRVLRRVVLLFQMGQPSSRSLANRYLHSVLEELMVRQDEEVLSGTARVHHERVAEVARHVRENPGQLFTVQELAEQAGYSVDHFTRFFTTAMGIPPKEFCIRVRMERAMLLLRESGMTVQQISRSLGYADVFFFSRQFKQQTGFSPMQWRERQQG